MNADPLERCFVFKSPTRSVLLPAVRQLLEKQLKGVEIGEQNRSEQQGKEKEELKSRWSCRDAGFVSAEDGAFAESGSGHDGDKAAEFSLWRSWDRDKVALPPLRSEGFPLPGHPNSAAWWEPSARVELNPPTM